ncbi:papilin isoform X2 [Bacillus rossius redtenbacheri]|uniref:papilin isoform X2 n=1 Tax=Bacillus rossius redtenbacheri TaxID=93214 RepID=UPI002FDDFFD2
MDLLRHLRYLALLILVLATYFSTVLARQHPIRHRHHRHKRQHAAPGRRPSSFVVVGGGGGADEGAWGPWSEPSPCSRSCGGGVASQLRQCADISIDGQPLCRGGSKRYFSCNIQDCPERSTDFRAEQCYAFNSVPFEGRLLEWVPYTKAPNKCELNCMPRGERYYYRHKTKVVDGTRCDDEKLDICVDGTCMPVGCDMMLGSPAREDLCRECGGDGSSCNTVRSVFENDDLQVGYNDILLIPEGATNIVIEELKPSNNYLAIRNLTGHYYLNGNWRIDYPRSLRFAGTLFHYERKHLLFFASESLKALGPTTEAIFVVLLYQETNPGIQYQYSISKGISQQTDPDSYAWIFDDFTPCSTTCGGGHQLRNVTCARRRDLEVVEDKLCNPVLEPERNKSCGTDPCPPAWSLGEWGACSMSCGPGGTRSRQVFCEQVVANGLPSIVDEQLCSESLGPRPSATEPCGEDVPCPTWFVGPWKPCNRLCGDGKHLRQVVCYHRVDGRVQVLEDTACSGEKPLDSRPCSLGPCEGVDWVYSDWSGCEDKCGLSSETRTAFCSNEAGKVYPDDRCFPYRLKELIRECENQMTCEFEWYTSQWSECSAACGSGVRSRKVFCGTFDGETVRKVSDGKCDPGRRYEGLKNCTGEEEECPGQWHAGPWSACSKTCGGGTMQRKVLCLMGNSSVDATKCDPNSILFSTEPCNDQPCSGDQILPMGPNADIFEEEECEDEEPYVITTTLDASMASGAAEGGTEGEANVTGAGTTQSDLSAATAHDIMLSDSTWVSLGSVSGEPFTSFPTILPDTLSTFQSTEGLSSMFTPLTTHSSSGTEESTESSPSSATTSSGDTSTDVDVSTISTDEGTMESTLGNFSSSSQISSLSSESSSTSSNFSEWTSDVTVSEDFSSSDSNVSSLSSDGMSSLTSILSSVYSSTDTPTSETITGDNSSSPSSTISSDLSSTSSDMYSSTSSNLSSSTTSDISSSTTSDLSSSTTSDLSSSSTSDVSLSSSTADSTFSSESTSMFSSSSSLGSTIESSPSSLSTSTLVNDSTNIFTETDEGSGTSDGGFTDEFASTALTGDVTPTSIVNIVDQEFDDTYDGSGDETASPNLSTGTDAASSDYSSTSTGGYTTTAVDMSGSSSASTVSESPSSTTESSVTPTSLSSSTASEEISSAFSTSSSATMQSSSTEEGTTEIVATSPSEETASSLAGGSTTEGTSVEEMDESGGEPLTTPSIAQTAFRVEQRPRKCKKRKVPKPGPTAVPCQLSAFGCCLDNSTAATGPFGKGCPHPTTCAETQHGCCPDGVSPAEGPDDLGCPPSLCEQTLFGCCPDRVGTALGNDFEGCEEPTLLPASCNTTEFGCCPDDIMPATGPDFEGCLDICEGSGDCGLCNNTLYGCCPDGYTAASGENFTGCETGFSSTTPGEPAEEDCSNSTYGCCPDGFTVAEGPYFYGCEDNCTQSYFGCCPDGLTAAKGPRYEGCHTSCQNERYGCCSDGVTAAHGPNQEGCCLNTPHGCCPDNIIPAQGPSLEGCGCLYSPYGCCPDNVTAARGPNKDGCGCQYTSHGCCPDAYTPAVGPLYQGCPCYTYQFGCCPDGVSIARGPHGEECGCQNTEFGCCSDGKTPASGPQDEGCGCEASKYGCCPDGEMPAQGDNFEECLDSPIIPSVACLEPTDRGTCKEYKVKWFFDAEYGGCSRFWYGGCEGNNNRFNNQEECKAMCVEPKGRAACYLPKISGPCKEYHPMWYYDAERKQCGQFIYGGCLGNNNKFETREECEGLCVLPDTVDVCEQPQTEGPCRGNFTRWYYDTESGQCRHFSYGGCKGNGNNFLTESACQQRCLQRGKSRVMDICALPKDMGPCPGAILRWHYDATDETCKQFVYGGCQGNANRFRTEEECRSECHVLSDAREQDTCLLPAMVGECYNYTERWYYDSFEVWCRTFYYGGCGGNHNNFPSMEACQQRCEPGFSTPKPPQAFLTEFCFKDYDQGPCSESVAYWFYDKGDGVCKQFVYGGCQGNENRFTSRQECEKMCGNAQDICALPRVVGPCRGRQTNWHYDPASDSCQEFEYGGCQGNGNRFADQQACEERCQRSRAIATARPTPGPVSTAYPAAVLQPSDICLAPVTRGPCSEEHPAWYFDGYSRTCQAFVYGGCGGNANRFESEEQCERQCGSFIGTDVCNLPYDIGPCRGAFPKWYYDPQTKSCRDFTYGGCAGNGNRFSSISECELVCLHREETQPSTNNTEGTAQAICSLPVDIGPCSNSYYKRWYFNTEHGTCLPFLYSGCAGNLNRFKNFQSCEEYCSVLSEEFGSGEPDQSWNAIDVGERPEKPGDSCEAAARECGQLRCPYRTDKYVDGECTRCRCHDPCRDAMCPAGTQCAVDLFSSPASSETEFRAVCRQVNKPGLCPRLTPGAGTCHKECETDADCAAELKCCLNGCGSSCISPFAPPEPQILTTKSPALPEEQTYIPWAGDFPASVTSPETAVSAEEGGVVTLHCVASGNPVPSVIWRKGRLTITGTGSRHKIFPDGRLRITALTRSDAGTYTCFASNGVGQPAQLDFTLDVKDPVSRPAEIIGDDDTFTVAELGAPAVLHCHATGWPRPLVTWFQGSRMMPRGSRQYEVLPDFSLHIRAVTLSSLGPYTCQAYNGVGSAASWRVTLQVSGPVHVGGRDAAFVTYVVPRPTRPPAPGRPEYPYRPTPPPHRRPRTRRPRPRPRPTMAALTTVPPAPLTAVPDTPRIYRVPVKTNVTMTQTLFPVGSDISIPCDVDGYPIPVVTWYKDEVPLQSSERIQITEGHRLMISKANSSDTGTYRCEAVNDFDKSSSATSLVVEGTYIHPNCTDNPFFANCRLIVEARYCTHKYYARFCCKSCTIAGQLPSFGPHLQKSGIISSSVQD